MRLITISVPFALLFSYGFAECRSLVSKIKDIAGFSASEFEGESGSDIPKNSGSVKSGNNVADTAEEELAPSIWDSKPIEIDAVNIQVLDKVSGKVIRKRVEVNKPMEFGGIKVVLKRCFKNAPEDSKEITAFVEITERKSLFARWLFASSPSVNVFEHPQYDVRVEF